MGTSTDESDFNEEQQAFLPTSTGEEKPSPPKTRYNAKFWFRALIEAAMLITILALLLDRSQLKISPSPVPTFPKKPYIFYQNHRYAHKDMFKDEIETLHTLHNWIELSSAARGFVQVHSTSHAKLPDPYIVAVNRTSDGPAYMVSAFHQLHCLSYLVEHYQATMTEEVAEHTAHCVDYLRQAIMCNADISLEGQTPEGAGWGAVHQCKDWDALLEWANKNSAAKWRGVIPDTAVL
ncbi:hypothetical protein ACMFMG_011322 [Clarireedia jacksonii]